MGWVIKYDTSLFKPCLCPYLGRNTSLTIGHGSPHMALWTHHTKRYVEPVIHAGLAVHWNFKKYLQRSEHTDTHRSTSMSYDKSQTHTRCTFAGRKVALSDSTMDLDVLYKERICESKIPHKLATLLLSVLRNVCLLWIIPLQTFKWRRIPSNFNVSFSVFIFYSWKQATFQMFKV